MNKFLNGLLGSSSSSEITFSSSFGCLLSAIFLSKTSESIKVNLFIKFLTNSIFSFSLYFTSFDVISDLELYVKSLGP